jgi:CelD/BcsL family acetyltransferase involved in cellulose biosynthesis
VTSATAISLDRDTTVERCASIAALQTLEGEWLDLMRRSSSGSPFQHPAWLIPWCQVFAANRLLFVAVRNRRRLIALAPAVLDGTQLVLAGGDESDYRTVLVDDAEAERAVGALHAALAGEGIACAFGDIPESSPWAALLGAQHGWRVEPSCVCPSVPLPETVDRWRSTLSPGLNRNLRRYGTRLADDAGTRYTTAVDPRDAPPAVNALLRLHSRRWHERGESGVLASRDVARFHEMSAPRLMEASVLTIHLLHAGGRLAGAQYVLSHGGTACSYVGGFDPEWRRYSPGTLLMAYAIEQAIGNGCREFDLLRGVEPCKYVWGAVNSTSVRLLLDAA